LIVVVAFLPVVAAALQGTDAAAALWNWLLVPGFLGGLVAGLLQLTAGIKRLHDRNKSGFWLLFFLGLPGAFNLINDRLDTMTEAATGAAQIVLVVAGFVLGVASIAIGIWMIVELGCLRGTVGPNRYGPDPLGGTEPAGGAAVAPTK
jgi:uncharacterized membrane protein YhaH (DUF805 family)